jgi:hypothetical protein
MDRAGERCLLVEQAAIVGLLPPGAERCERPEAPHEKGGQRHDCRDEQRALDENYDHGVWLRSSMGLRGGAAGSITSS